MSYLTADFESLDDFLEKNIDNIALQDIPIKNPIEIEGLQFPRPVMLLDCKNIKKTDCFFCVVYKKNLHPIRLNKKKFIVLEDVNLNNNYTRTYIDEWGLTYLRDKIKEYKKTKQYKIGQELKDLKKAFNNLLKEYLKTINSNDIKTKNRDDNSFIDDESSLSGTVIFYQEDLDKNSWKKYKIIKSGIEEHGTISIDSPLAQSTIGKKEKSEYKNKIDKKIRGTIIIHKVNN